MDVLGISCGVSVSPEILAASDSSGNGLPKRVCEQWRRRCTAGVVLWVSTILSKGEALLLIESGMRKV